MIIFAQKVDKFKLVFVVIKKNLMFILSFLISNHDAICSGGDYYIIEHVIKGVYVKRL